MGTDGLYNLKDTKAKLDYLKELLTDRNILANDPRTYLHVGKILEKEILRIRSALFATYGINPISDSELPDPEGPKVSLQAKVYMPADNNNSFNFVGRILGPDGSTAKCLQQCLGVKIMVRGRGSMRDRKKEEANLGKPNWEHLNDRLHVVLTVEDYENRAKARLDKASEYITLFLKESMKGSDKDDKVKQMQLMELSFRREPCPSWRFNCNNLLDVSFPHKPGAIFSNAAANFLNFGYAYPSSAPLFTPLHHNPLPHAHHLGPYGQQHQQHHHHQQQQQQQQPHQHAVAQQQPVGSQTMSGHGMNQPSHNLATGYSHTYPNSLNAAAFLLGHSPNSATGYATSPYSPNSHAQSAAAAQSGLAAMGPVNYWASQGLYQVPTEYAFAQSTQLNGAQTGKYPEDATTLMNPNGSSSSQNGTGAYLTPRAAPEDLMQPYVMTELGACTLETLGEFDPRSAVVQHPGGLYPADVQPGKFGGTLASTVNGTVASSASSPSITNVSTSITNGSSKPSSKRYSQKHNCQMVHGPQTYRQTSSPSMRNSAPGGNRSTVVTVRIGSSEQRRSPPPIKGVDNSKESDPNPRFLKAPCTDSSAIKVGPVTDNLQAIRPNADGDWPKLPVTSSTVTGGGRDKSGTNKTIATQRMTDNERGKSGTDVEDSD